MFCSRRDTLCIQVLKEVDGILKVNAARKDAVDCVKQTALEFREVVSRMRSQLPEDVRAAAPHDSFVEAVRMADSRLSPSDPTAAAHRVKFHLDSLMHTLHIVEHLCGAQIDAISHRCGLLQRVVQVIITLSKAALFTQSQLQEINASMGTAGVDIDAVPEAAATASAKRPTARRRSTVVYSPPDDFAPSVIQSDALPVDDLDAMWLEQAAVTVVGHAPP